MVIKETGVRTYSRETAEDLLFGPLDESASQSSPFSFSHDTAQFDSLRAQKYASTDTVPTSFDTYQTNRVENSAYQAPRTETATTSQRYFNDSNPVPTQSYQTFRPRIFDFGVDSPLQSNDTDQAVPTYASDSAPDLSSAEKIAEVEFDTPARNQTQFAEVKAVEQSMFTPKLRLNAKGLIVAVAFFAIVAMLTVLIVLNSVIIGANKSKIASLTAKNAEIIRNYNEMVELRDIAKQKGEDYAWQHIIGENNDLGYEELEPVPF